MDPGLRRDDAMYTVWFPPLAPLLAYNCNRHLLSTHRPSRRPGSTRVTAQWEEPVQAQEWIPAFAGMTPEKRFLERKRISFK